jgi:hypothetical protein
MLPIVDKPLIQYAVEEAIEAGATKLVFVTGSSKRAIEDHFDTDPELEQALTDSGKTELLQSIQDIVPPGVACIYIRQGKPLGLGHAVLCARPAVGNHPFFVHLADDLIAPIMVAALSRSKRCHVKARQVTVSLLLMSTIAIGSLRSLRNPRQKTRRPIPRWLVAIYWHQKYSASWKISGRVLAERFSLRMESPLCWMSHRSSRTHLTVSATIVVANLAIFRQPLHMA